MRILGIDPGIGITGWSILEPGQTRHALIAAGTITTTPNAPTPDRLIVLHQSLGDLMTTYQPTELALEKLFFAKNVTTAMRVSEARGVVLLTAAERLLAVYEYTPPEVKQLVVGYGNATKRQVIAMLPHHLNGALIPTQDDAADAIAIALTHLAHRATVHAGAVGAL